MIRRRLLLALPVLLLVACGTFGLLHLAPGDAVDAMVIAGGGGDAALASELRARYGLDQPLLVQLSLYLLRLVQFDFGVSPVHNRPVLALITERLPISLLLMLTATAFAVSLGVVLGVSAAAAAGRWRDRLILAAALVIYAMPSFWVGLMLILVFAVTLGWLPVGGFETAASGLSGMARVLDIARHLILPTLALALLFVSVHLRLMRAGMLDLAGADFVRMARAKGVPRRRVLWAHLARNAVLPVIAMVGVQASTLLGGAVVIESVFSLPGLGRLAYDSVVARDLATLMGLVVVSAVIVLTVTLVVDLVMAALDPRVRLR
ncbi:MAG: ABC transporter permease [Alphaproteobacteria bacterium]|nr:ABC transporter permease [Alphaproteobacteria bacterium]